MGRNRQEHNDKSQQQSINSILNGEKYKGEKSSREGRERHVERVAGLNKVVEASLRR